MQLDGRNVTIMGLGHFGGGVAAARWAARRGAVVTVTDLADCATLAEPLAALAGEPIAHFHLGGHREDDFRTADVVVVNPAVQPGNPYMKIAADAGARLTSEIELFLEVCPAKVVGVTGTNGKSTTTAMIAAIFEADGRKTWLGGNLGGSLLDHLDEISPDDWAVLELSSFQLHRLSPANMPHVAVVTNCVPNHLNWHGSYAEYAAAKRRILTGQSAEDLAVLNTACGEVASWAGCVRGRRLPLVDAAELPELPVPGEHNRQNAILAATAALGVGCGGNAVREGLASFRPLPGRLEMIGRVDGRRCYNDTTATTPESAVAAIVALAERGEPVWLLAGGSDKGADFSPLARAIATHARGAAFFGAVRNVLLDRLAAVSPNLPMVAVETLDEAFCWCRERSGPGEAIVLSPGCASLDQFQNFRHRGAAFAAMVQRAAAPSGHLL